MEPETVNYLSSYLTPLIGLATAINLITVAYIAVQQYRLDKKNIRLQQKNINYKIHHDLYEKRLNVFQETMQLLRNILTTNEPSWDSLLTTLNKIEDDAYFLFDEEIHLYIKKLIDKGHEKRHLTRKINRLNSEERIEKALDQDEELEDWVLKHLKICREKFDKYLSYKIFLKR